MEGYILVSSLQEFLRFRRIFPWLFVAVAVFGAARAYHGLVPNSPPGDAYVLLSSTLVFRILALASAIFSAAIVAQEVQGRTIVYLLTRPVARWKLLVFRTLAASIVVFGISVLMALGVASATGELRSDLLVRDLEAIGAGSVAYVALFVFVSLLINRSMILCLLFAFVWETSVPNIPGDLHRLTISSYLASIAQHPKPPTAPGVLDALGGLLGGNTIAPTTAWVTVVGIALVSLAAGAYWFSHFEYMAREDAE